MADRGFTERDLVVDEPESRRPGRPRGRTRYTGPTPSQRTLIERLRAARGEWVHVDTLCDTVYRGAKIPLGWRSVLSKHLCDLRVRHGFDIVNRYGGDYALMEKANG